MRAAVLDEEAPDQGGRALRIGEEAEAQIVQHRQQAHATGAQDPGAIDVRECGHVVHVERPWRPTSYESKKFGSEMRSIALASPSPSAGRLRGRVGEGAAAARRSQRLCGVATQHSPSLPSPASGGGTRCRFAERLSSAVDRPRRWSTQERACGAAPSSGGRRLLGPFTSILPAAPPSFTGEPTVERRAHPHRPPEYFRKGCHDDEATVSADRVHCRRSHGFGRRGDEIRKKARLPVSFQILQVGHQRGSHEPGAERRDAEIGTIIIRP